MNNLRLRHSLIPRKASLMPSGTSSNESLHAELNKWFRNQPEIYLGTLMLQLRVNWIAKLMVHNTALYAPLLRYHDQGTLLIALASKWVFGDAWATWVRSDLVLPLADSNASTKTALDARRVPRRITQKRPAYSVAVRGAPRKKKIKRTPLNLKRVKI
jgi:hypothetical protein